jgi:hypothetical protein
MTEVTGPLLEYADDAAAAEDLLARQWTDGLPVVLPTPERVTDMLATVAAAADELLGPMPTHWNPTYVHHIAVNAVLAGCRPDYFPAVLAAVRAVLAPEFNLYGVQGTTNPCGVLVLVNGPIADAIGLNHAHNLFGQGYRANATIGRAVRLCLINIGGGRPQIGDMSTLGNPNKYGSCIAEDERGTPWEPYHVSRGYSSDQSTVTVQSAVAPLNVITMSDDGEDVLNTLARAMITPGGNGLFLDQEMLIVLSPTQAARIARRGYTRAVLCEQLWQRGRVEIDALSTTDERALRDWRRASIRSDNGRDYVYPTAGPEGIHVVVAGGEGPHSAIMPGFNGSRVVTSLIETGR